MFYWILVSNAIMKRLSELYFLRLLYIHDQKFKKGSCSKYIVTADCQVRWYALLYFVFSKRTHFFTPEVDHTGVDAYYSPNYKKEYFFPRAPKIYHALCCYSEDILSLKKKYNSLSFAMLNILRYYWIDSKLRCK